MNKKNTFIAVAGNIGTGKTTLASMLANSLQGQVQFESVEDNPYLADFYGDMKRWSFPLQVFFLNNRFRVHEEMQLKKGVMIQDRSIYEDKHIFARNLFESNLMDKRDYYNYLDLYEKMMEFLNPPTLIVYLRKSVPRLVEQIAKRGRDYESNIERSYLENLNRYYDDWIANYEQGKALVIDSDNLDFVSRSEDFSRILQQVMSTLDADDSHKPQQRFRERIGVNSVASAYN